MPLIPNSNKNYQNDQNKAPVQQGVQFNKTAPIYTFSDLILSDKTFDELKTVVSAKRIGKRSS